MSDLLGISGNAVMAYQRALGTVSNNIANVATDGYSRQDITLLSGAPRQLGNAFIGTGVIFDRVQRQYDAFAESNLRNSNSDLQSQLPMVDYANRVIDVMGAENMGLVSALDQFFSSARSLSSNPASTVLRGAFMRDSEGLASRFGQLSSQLDLVDSETRQAVESSIGEINTLAQQLGDVNKQLTKMPTLERQPAELLDQRDLLLRQLSEFSRINTSFKGNGVVLVSLGASLTQDVLVDGSKVTRVGLNNNAASPEKLSLVLDPYGSPTPLAGITSGQVSGLLSFREQVLSSTRNSLDFLANTLVREVNAVHQQGIDGYGEPAGDLFALDANASSVSGSLRVVVDDPMRLAAAAQFRVIKNSNNAGTAEARISYAPSPLLGPGNLSDLFVNNAHPSAGQAVVLNARTPLAAVATIQGGLDNVVVYLDDANSDQQLQLITRDGRHLLGQALSESQQERILTSEQGMATGATYSTDYLNTSGLIGYQGMSVFYGARAAATVREEHRFEGKVLVSTPVAVPALLSGSRITASQTTGIAAGALVLNGTVMGELPIAEGDYLQAGDIADWINNAGVSGVTATASNEVRVLVDSLKLDRSLSLNSVSIERPSSGFASAEALVAAINLQSEETGVVASYAKTGELVLSNISGKEGQDITVGGGSAGNALNITSDVYTGRVDISRDLVTGEDTPLEFGFGDTGQPSDLALLGFRTGASIIGKVPEDVLVFVTGSSAASVTATFTGAATPATTALRAQTLQLKFTAADRYQITDQRTGTVLAERSFDATELNAGIDYRGLKLSFTTPPKAGDRFVLDGNKDGTGNNENMLRLAALESATLVGGKTISASYIDHVNDMGNVSRQASIAKEALTVVHDQAVAARDQVSGVSLDEEAANLIRFQQAYQASAKVMQVAGTLFDAVLAVR